MRNFQAIGCGKKAYMTMLGCLSSLSTEISLRVVLGIPSSSNSNLIRYDGGRMCVERERN
jgi:hypothetical protein